MIIVAQLLCLMFNFVYKVHSASYKSLEYIDN